MPENPFWSVIVATYQRGKVLFDSIEYILALSYPHFAFLVIDQTPQHEADTEQFIRACKTKYAERFRWHFGARVNLQNARNVGAKMARGENLLFCNDRYRPARKSDRIALAQPDGARRRCCHLWRLCGAKEATPATANLCDSPLWAYA